jgi:hypothetical protein
MYLLEMWVENILRKIILQEYLRTFQETRTWIFLNTLKIWRTFEDPIVNVYVPQVYPPNSWQCSTATVAAQLLVARISRANRLFVKIPCDLEGTTLRCECYGLTLAVEEE